MSVFSNVRKSRILVIMKTGDWFDVWRQIFQKRELELNGFVFTKKNLTRVQTTLTFTVFSKTRLVKGGLILDPKFSESFLFLQEMWHKISFACDARCPWKLTNKACYGFLEPSPIARKHTSEANKSHLHFNDVKCFIRKFSGI